MAALKPPPLANAVRVVIGRVKEEPESIYGALRSGCIPEVQHSLCFYSPGMGARSQSLLERLMPHERLMDRVTE